MSPPPDAQKPKEQLLAEPAQLPLELRRISEAPVQSQQNTAGFMPPIKENESEFQAVFHASPVPMVVVDGDGIIRQVNPAAARLRNDATSMLDKRPGDAFRCLQHIRTPAGCGFGPTCKECVLRRTVLRTLDSGESSSRIQADITLMEQQDVALHHILISTAPLQVCHRRMALICLEDVTEQRRSDAKFKEIHERYRSLFESMDEGFALCEMIFDPAGKPVDFRYLEVNPAFARLTGLPVDQVVGRRAREVIPGLEDFWIEHYNQIVQSGQSERIVHKIEELGRYYEVHAYSMANDRFAAIYSDATVRLQAEEQLRASQERLQLAAEAAGFGTYSYDFVTGACYCSPEINALLGLSPTITLTPNPAELYLLTHPEDQASFQAAVVAAMDPRGSGLFRSDVRVIWPDQSIHWLLVHGQVFFEGEGASRHLIRAAGATVDITDSKRHDEMLRQSEQRFEALAAATFEGIAVSENGRILDANEQFAKLLGYSPDEMIGQDTRSFVAPENQDQVSAHMAREDDSVMEQVLLRKDGSRIIVEARARMVSYQNRQMRFTAIRDITERKRVEQALRSREAELLRAQAMTRTLIELLPDAVLVISRLHIAYANPAAARLFGAPRPEDLHGRSLLDLVPQDRHASVTADFERFFAGKGVAPPHEGYILRLDGTRLNIETSAAALEYNGELSVISIFRDITERKEAEEALRIHQRQLAEAMDLAHLAHWEYDVITGLFTFNARFYAVYGTTAQREGGYLMPAETYSRTFLHPDDAHVVADEITKALATADPQYAAQLEHRIIRRDGELRWVAVRIRITKDTRGRTISIHGANQDITDRRLLEEQLRQAQKMEAVGQLAGGIAHDFRNQLTVISGFGELLRDDGYVLPAGESMLTELLKAANQSAYLTGQLLAFSRKQTLHPKLVDINEILPEACSMLTRLFREDVKLTITRAAGTAGARVDAVQLQHAILNIANNAHAAMPHGGELTVRSFCTTPDPELRRRHPEATAESYVAIAISDTGHGMDERTLAHIFEPFFTTRPPGQGTGLGLAMVYGFVSQSDGFIDVQSKPGHGSTFTLYFPQVAASIAETPREKPAPLSSVKNERVLIVEDEPAVRQVIVAFLKRAGYETLEATDVHHALTILADRTQGVDLLVSDVVMPGLSGVVLAQRARELRPRLAVLLVSGYADQQEIERGLPEVHGSLLQKPFEFEDMLRAVRHAIDSRPAK